jgi:hypothetical protein
LIEEILDLLRQSTALRDCQVWERDETPTGAFILKVRCRASTRLTLQVWIKQTAEGRRYSYQLLSNGTTVMRWDNTPHWTARENFPHHFHDSNDRKVKSPLTGDPLADLPVVLQEARKYLEAET